jgi:hypothetical protein
MITNAPYYVTNHTLKDDLKVLLIKDVIEEKSINHHDKLGNHSNLYCSSYWNNSKEED